MDIPQSAPLGLLHDHPYGFLIALIVPLHGSEHPDLGGDAIQLGRQLPQRFCSIVPVLFSALLPQAKAGDHIFRGRHLVLGVFQLPAAVLQIFLRIFPPLSAGGQILLQLSKALPGALPVLFQSPDIRLAAGNLRLQVCLLGPQLQEPFAQALRGSGHLDQLLLGGRDRGAHIGKVPINLLHPLLGLGDLAFQTAGPILLAPKLLFNAA